MAIILTTRHMPGLWMDPSMGPPVPNALRTPQALAERQKAHLALNPASHTPQKIHERIEAYIGGGVWRIKCRCGERTHTDPEWHVAYCFGCGAQYVNILFPDNREAIERLLCLRPVQGTRNWYPHETYDELIQEQVAHGDPIV